MMPRLSIGLFFFLSLTLFAVMREEDALSRSHISGKVKTVQRGDGTGFDASVARVKLDKLLPETSFLQDAEIAPMPELDLPGLYAFSALPKSTGRAGEVIFLIGADEFFSTAQAIRDFERLMRKFQIWAPPDGPSGAWFDARRIAYLFIRFRAMRRGVILDRPDGHVLLKPEAIPTGQFVTPQLVYDASGIRLKFWLFDTDRMEPAFWQVQVARNGKTISQPPTENPHPSQNPQDQKRVDFAMREFKAHYAERAVEILYPHVVPSIFENFQRNLKPGSSPLLPGMLGPQLKADEYTVHAYIRFAEDRGWQHIDVILTEDASGNIARRGFFTMPMNLP